MVAVADDASKILTTFLKGSSSLAQAEQQLLELSLREFPVVAELFVGKAKLILQQSGGGNGDIVRKVSWNLISVAISVDALLKSQGSGESDSICTVLLESVINITGGPSRSPKDASQRIQVVSFIEQLVDHVSCQDTARRTLLEYAKDNLPVVRAKALQGLRRIPPDKDIVQRVICCTRDACKYVRVCAVESFRPSCAHGLLDVFLERLDDTEPCVREALFHKLATEPCTFDLVEPHLALRLVISLRNENDVVKKATKTAVTSWIAHLGGPLQLLGKCDILSDEISGEECAKLLSRHYLEQSAKQVNQWLRSYGHCFPGLESHCALLGRFTLGMLPSQSRNDTAPVPLVCKIMREAFSTARGSSGHSGSCYLLRQILHILVVLEVPDEASRRHFLSLGKEVLLMAPIKNKLSTIWDLHTKAGASFSSAMDLGMLLMRKSMSLDIARDFRSGQDKENACSQQVMRLIHEMCCRTLKDMSESTLEHSSCCLLGQHLEMVRTEIGDALKSDPRLGRSRRFSRLGHHSTIQVNGLEAQGNQQANQQMLSSLIDLCARILTIVSSLLKWSVSEFRKDRALRIIWFTVVQPIVRMKNVPEEIELRALQILCLFCCMDFELTQFYWHLFIRCVQRLSEHSVDTGLDDLRVRRAVLAAAALSDCSRRHGLHGFFTRDQILSAASALAAVPYRYREVVVQPLCAWFMSFGGLYFEECMKGPLPEITWALGWLLVEAFRNKTLVDRITLSGNGNGLPKASALSTDLIVFFDLLSKHPCKHGEAILCLAVESIVQSGLWRLAVSLPIDDRNAKFASGFSWPKMFDFIRTRISSHLQLRLWRCCLQVCITSPALAPWAQVPFALVVGARNAPPGALGLIEAAASLGAHDPHLLQSRAEALRWEQVYVTELDWLGVKIKDWIPTLDMDPPKGRLHAAVDESIRRYASRGAIRKRKALAIQDAGHGSRPKPSSESDVSETPQILDGIPSHALQAGKVDSKFILKRKRLRGQPAPIDLSDGSCDNNFTSVGVEGEYAEQNSDYANSGERSEITHDYDAMLVDFPPDPRDSRFTVEGAILGDNGKIKTSAYKDEDLMEIFANEPPLELHPDPNFPGLRQSELQDSSFHEIQRSLKSRGWIASRTRRCGKSETAWISAVRMGSWRLALLLARLQILVWQEKDSTQDEIGMADGCTTPEFDQAAEASFDLRHGEVNHDNEYDPRLLEEEYHCEERAHDPETQCELDRTMQKTDQISKESSGLSMDESLPAERVAALLPTPSRAWRPKLTRSREAGKFTNIFFKLKQGESVSDIESI
eukprot:CAMPEP_0169206822 /NCGR_PEP_ID=MMETSP1016-20121227/13250_1 /TAXON_ID=342587 /ORGANISM="Karlodinium micrum, Strain CCMP2283" /LENGTH=1297 /DNA_ID=CAMNT_0009284049 /DNA_START=14 /DNA_END=3907 /DNA_ORIENTATION=+